MASDNTILVFVHGWSVTNLDTYGQLPIRLQAELSNAIVKNIFLGKYISFHDEVQLADISRAFQTAITDQLADILTNDNRFICITHSTGGPVVRDWWKTYYESSETICPMSHLIMLAPANFGSALAQLGKGKLSRIKSWFGGVEPGQGVLNWLELGSKESWKLNELWIKSDGSQIGPDGIFPFSIIGQSIDRRFYDHVNSYTGEIGSDGVVRSVAANLNAIFISVKQGEIESKNGKPYSRNLEWESNTAPKTAFRIAKGLAHSSSKMGILASPRQPIDNENTNSTALVEAVLKCIGVKNNDDYNSVAEAFNAETAIVQQQELVEKPTGLFGIFERSFIHDRFSMIIFRVLDSENYPITDYDLTFTSDNNNPNHLPPGFFADRQQNSLSPETVTYFINYDIMKGCPAIMDPDDDTKELRPKQPGIKNLGLVVKPHMEKGFVRYIPLNIAADTDFLEEVIKPNATTLIDICMQRVVDKKVFRLIHQSGPMPVNDNFSKIKPGNDIAN